MNRDRFFRSAGCSGATAPCLAPCADPSISWNCGDWLPAGQASGWETCAGTWRNSLPTAPPVYTLAYYLSRDRLSQRERGARLHAATPRFGPRRKATAFGILFMREMRKDLMPMDPSWGRSQRSKGKNGSFAAALQSASGTPNFLARRCGQRNHSLARTSHSPRQFFLLGGVSKPPRGDLSQPRPTPWVDGPPHFN